MGTRALSARTTAVRHPAGGRREETLMMSFGKNNTRWRGLGLGGALLGAALLAVSCGGEAGLEDGHEHPKPQASVWTC